MLSSVFSVSLWFGTSEMGFRRSELGGTMTSLGVVPFAFLCGLLLIAQPQFPIFDLQSPSALNRLHTGAPVPDLRSSISHLRSQAFRIPLAPCRFAAHAFLCVLCVSVVQFGTVTVIEGNSPQRRRVHREDLNPQMTTTPDSAQPCFPLCSLCLCGSAHRRSEIGVRSSEIGVGGNDDITWSRALRVPLRSSVNRPTEIPISDLRLSASRLPLAASPPMLSSVFSVSLWFNSGR
jgi:hypothetical protein